MCIIIMIYNKVHLIFTEPPASKLDLAPSASSTCPLPEEIDTLHRNAKHLLEETSYTKTMFQWRCSLDKSGLSQHV